MSEVIYESSYQPDPARALDVLAFIFTPAKAFATEQSDLTAVEWILAEAKEDAVDRWLTLNKKR